MIKVFFSYFFHHLDKANIWAQILNLSADKLTRKWKTMWSCSLTRWAPPPSESSASFREIILKSQTVNATSSFKRKNWPELNLSSLNSSNFTEIWRLINQQNSTETELQLILYREAELQHRSRPITSTGNRLTSHVTSGFRASFDTGTKHLPTRVDQNQTKYWIHEVPAVWTWAAAVVLTDTMK